MASQEVFSNDTASDTALVEDEEEENLMFFAVFIFAVLLPLSLFILLGNALVISVVRGYSQERYRAVYSFVCSLAFNDCLVGIALVPVYYTGIFVEELKTDFYYCMSIITILLASSSLSMLHVLIISVDRYLAIYFPLKYHSFMTSRNITLTIALTWTIAFVNALLPFLGWRTTARQLDYCNVDKVFPFSYITFHFTCCFIIPLFITFAIYLRIIQAARHQIRKIGSIHIAGDSGGQAAVSHALTSRQPVRPFTLPNATVYRYDHQSAKLRVTPSMSDLKAITTTATVLGTFVLCFSPSYIAFFVLHSLNSDIIDADGEQRIRAPATEIIFNLMTFSNAALNPVIYCFRYKEFREAMKKGVGRMCPAQFIAYLPPRRSRAATVETISMDQVTIQQTSCPSAVFVNHDFRLPGDVT